MTARYVQVCRLSFPSPCRQLLPEGLASAPFMFLASPHLCFLITTCPVPLCSGLLAQWIMILVPLRKPHRPQQSYEAKVMSKSNSLPLRSWLSVFQRVT